MSHTSHDDVCGVLGANSEGAPGMPTIGPCGRAAIWLARTEVWVVRPSGDQPGRGQVQRRVQPVAHPDEQRARVLVRDDGRLADLTRRAEERPQQRPQADHQRRRNRRHHGQRLPPSRLDFHADSPPGQRHRGSARKELITRHLGPRRQPEAVTRPPLPAALFSHVRSPSGPKNAWISRLFVRQGAYPIDNRKAPAPTSPCDQASVHLRISLPPRLRRRFCPTEPGNSRNRVATGAQRGLQH